jgi:hypothetical protein
LVVLTPLTTKALRNLNHPSVRQAAESDPSPVSSPEYHFSMSEEEIKKGLIALSEAEQSEVTAFLFHLRHSRDPDYQDIVSARLSDSDSSHWVTPEEFEKRLNQR